MAEDLSSMVTNGVNVVAAEASDSNSSAHSFALSNPVMHDYVVSSTKFKGVVRRRNGHWGAQIYGNHQRFWLGTFKSEKEAAMAYDRAAIKLRSGNSHRNIPWTRITVEETKFQNIYSAEAVVNMIKDGSYQAKFADYLRTSRRTVDTEVGFNLTRVQTRGVICRQLFQKELTPSDVSKQNRLVIPKKYAMTYFPCITGTAEEENQVDNMLGDVQLVFFDKMMRSWKFRYCYGKISRSFVFTRGWCRYVREKQLKANDTITFFMCEEGATEAQPFLMIDANRGDGNSGLVEGADQNASKTITNDDENGKELEDCEDLEMDTEPIQDSGITSFRLFGFTYLFWSLHHIHKRSTTVLSTLCQFVMMVNLLVQNFKYLSLSGGFRIQKYEGMCHVSVVQSLHVVFIFYSYYYYFFWVRCIHKFRNVARRSFSIIIYNPNIVVCEGKRLNMLVCRC
ncbi:AP2/ERF and B3 domain-containing transcription factor At1g50680 isoform X1 [Ziziphus jujuba]|uniref:AP2/ERF and B3 domain-containing transcription factor At1g50680 isoform X1 n=1 Tax=Ziziphus jujuba TaxID=326968 RepID=A0ABM3I8F8_ZIZJJ|nr:AP2/ERF and B3 domain-containing transcription factor At1g50680 isoform X1 [Ziziphus jujuba]XP_060671928.1 AP2/ERF and B3 domain-containing transcription factor At1g50680 isoform X1 [Ziziphus jujuba]